MNTERWPLDFAALRRGDRIPAEQVERATQTSRQSRSFSLKSVKLAGTISDYFREHHGDEVAVVSVKDALHILTHAEQAQYSRRRLCAEVSAVGRVIKMGHSIDFTQLSEDERQRHDKWCIRSSWLAQQMHKPPPPVLSGSGEQPKE